MIDPLREGILSEPDLNKKLVAFENKAGSYGMGVDEFVFEFEDVSGKKVAFSDFKGKYVFVDCWATWCGPCKYEIPSLKKLERQLHGEEIIFVSISFDKPKDKGKSKDFVRKEKLGGVQLITDNAFDTEMARTYRIVAIPRFLLFDKEGKVVDTDAKRPSDERLKVELEALLN